MENGKGLLDGVVVLDLGRVLACPYAAVLLADMGASNFSMLSFAL